MRAEQFLDVCLTHFPGDAVEMNHFGGGQDPVLPRHLLRVEPVQSAVSQVILHRAGPVTQLEFQGSVSYSDVFL